MKIISKTNNRIIVEHDNFRAMITPDLYNHYKNGLLTAEELTENGIPISVRWSDFINVHLTGKDIENALYKHGIHTMDDLLKNTKAVSGAILEAVGYTAGTIYKTVESQKRQQL